MVRALLLRALFFLCMSPGMLQAAPHRDPVGERANYMLDKNASRTSGMVVSGKASGYVDEFLPNHPDGPSYSVKLDYEFVVSLMGTYKGSMKMVFADEFFSPAFMQELRKTGYYESPEFKIKYEGRADARNLDGGFYPQCDKIFIYDIKISPAFRLKVAHAPIGKSIKGRKKRAGPTIENLQIHAHIFEGVPAIGAVKLDLSGKVQGVATKAGFDYKKP